MRKLRAGFTIIEVVLVLAVAGLIFLVVFSALPAMQVSSRDTQRRESISTLISKIKDFQTNNRGALPNGTDVTVVGDNIEKSVTSVVSASDSSWVGFYRDYLGKAYRDPLGYMYNLKVVKCEARNADQECPNTDAVNAKNQFFSDRNYTIVVVTGATCYGDTAVGTASPRKVAALYKLEGAGTYCQGT
ncbi:type II secretion system protein [Candidatus Saccharibacteria bacterium]|nr:type II secretion system protein [Candidatus Saccharibacteria bacterium]